MMTAFLNFINIRTFQNSLLYRGLRLTSKVVLQFHFCDTNTIYYYGGNRKLS